jgi:ATP-dependent protease ClpP protease subunit
MERDRFFTPEEALDYGLIDHVYAGRNGTGNGAYSSSSSSSST